eukprot:TRINITY_DN14146_c0_g1_i1.p1 TRINITY_DN14146_c0_g1~~TRINITY_DN14146_c0_g1_i1.p1  ORF type:complete len:283 (-),score=52.05 TRINITY_DN14146_c0_g1_i1:33-881(-)
MSLFYKRKRDVDSPPAIEPLLKVPKVDESEDCYDGDELTICTLPDEVLCLVFSLLVSGSDWYSVLQVNHRFHRLGRRCFDPSLNDNNAIRWAARHGKLEAVLSLLRDERVDPSQGGDKAIRWACWNGHTDVVKALLRDRRVNPSANDNYSIRVASQHGWVDVIRELMRDERVDPSALQNVAIHVASANGHLETVRELLKDPRVDPSVKDGEGNDAIRKASENGHLEVVKELATDLRVRPPVNFVLVRMMEDIETRISGLEEHFNNRFAKIESLLIQLLANKS